MVFVRLFILVMLSGLLSVSFAEGSKPFDAAAAFGARLSVAHVSLSPDGNSVAYITPLAGQGSALYTLRVDQEGAKPQRALAADGKPERLGGCHWVSNERLVCTVYGVTRADLDLLAFTREFAVNADGSNQKLLSTKRNAYTHGLQLGGGSIVDWLPDQDGSVMMTRIYLPDDHLGTHIASTELGLGVDKIDTRTATTVTVERPKPDAVTYISDGRGTIRVMGLETRHGGDETSPTIYYSYRKQGDKEWRELTKYNYINRDGFEPFAVDHDKNVAYGFKKKEGRMAVYSIVLDGSMREELLYARSDVDVDGVIGIGRRNRVVGVSYSAEVRRAEYFDSAIQSLLASLAKALPGNPSVDVIDSSVDENKLLIFASSDTDPGVYYLFDRQSHQLKTFLVIRTQLEGVKLATMKPVSYPAADGTTVPGYLTLPPGIATAKGLPAIVLPHGGPGARDEWGFDWLAQFYAARGFAVMQPNFRGSLGYGDAWYGQNGFRAWSTAVGDVLDAGRWLVKQGIADPAKLAVVGWSYGGYAALQSVVVDPTVFKAVIAIAPVTDLQQIKNERLRWTDYRLVSDMIGSGPQVKEGSPAQNANKIKVPVLLFHGGRDRNVAIAQSKMMAKSLEVAGVPHELVIWDDLDHQLDDSGVRAELLRKSEEFLLKGFVK